jgi:hypothetical protein
MDFHCDSIYNVRVAYVAHNILPVSLVTIIALLPELADAAAADDDYIFT